MNNFIIRPRCIRTLESLKIDVNNAGHTFSEAPKQKDNSSSSLLLDLHLNELLLMFRYLTSGRRTRTVHYKVTEYLMAK